MISIRDTNKRKKTVSKKKTINWHKIFKKMANMTYVPFF